MSSIICLLRRASMMAKPQGGGNIPSDYQAVDYVKTRNASSAFVTDYVPTTTCKVEVEVEITGTTSGRVGAWFGSRTGWNNNTFYFKVATDVVTTGFKTDRTISTQEKWTVGHHIFAIDSGKFIIDNEVIAEYADTFTPTYPIYLMGVNSGGSSMSNGPIGAQLYGCKIYDNGVLLRDYRPVKRVSDEAVGVFDVVNQTFVPML